MPIDWVPKDMIWQEEGPISVFVSEEEYLSTVYRPECDYIDGRLTDRNVGEWNHSSAMSTVMYLLDRCDTERRWYVLPACRTEVAPGRYRCPDVQMISRLPKIDRIVRRRSLLCVEVISPHDTWQRLRSLVKDHLLMGVEHIWAIDPEEREVFDCDEAGFYKLTDRELTIAGTPVRISMAEIFADL